MRATGLVVWIIVLLIAAPGAAQASAPVPGGRYVDHLREQGANGRVTFTLANDGLEFAAPSYVEIYRCGFFVGLTGSFHEPEAVAVNDDGRFRYADIGGSVHGRFIRGGRIVVGRATGFGSPACRRHISVRFRARLTGTPNAARPGLPSSCDPVTTFEIRYTRGQDSYELAEQGIGCTTARRLARQWHASPECAALSAPGTTCSLGAATCARIPLGVWRRLARIRCSTPERPGGAAELIYLRACTWPGVAGFTVSAINVDCPTARAFPLKQLLERDGPCGNLKPLAFGRVVTCAPIAGYVCTARIDIHGIAFHARCVDEPTRSFALAIWYEAPSRFG